MQIFRVKCLMNTGGARSVVDSKTCAIKIQHASVHSFMSSMLIH